MANPLVALRYRDFAAYAAARFCATICWQMLNVAVGWQIYALTHDALNLGFVGLAQFLPFVLLVLPAGHTADRADRRLVLMGAYALSVTAVVVLLIFTMSGSHQAWPVFLAMILHGTSRAFWMPTSQAMTPNLVPPEAFPNAIATNAVVLEVGVIVGPALGGLLYLLGPSVVYWTALGLLLLIVVLISGIKPARTSSAKKSFSSTELLEGLRFVIRRRTVLGAISLDLFAVLFGGATALLPIYASDVLHIGPAGLGLLRTAPGIGATACALWLALNPIERHVGRWMFSGVAVFGVSTLVFGASTTFWVSLVALVLLGAGDMISVYIRQVLVQLETPDDIRGRVSAVSSMFIGSSNTLGEFESGATARWFGTIPAVIVGGVATLVIVGSYLKLFPELRLMDRFRRN